MPSDLIKNYAEKTGKSIDELEKLWEKAKEITSEKGFSEENSPDLFYSYTHGVFKRMLGIKDKGK